MTDTGRPVTRAEALEIATRTLERAEQERRDAARRDAGIDPAAPDSDVTVYSIAPDAPKCVAWAHCDGDKIHINGGTVIVDKAEWDMLQAKNAQLKAELAKIKGGPK